MEGEGMLKPCSIIGADNGTIYLLKELHGAGIADSWIAEKLGVARMTIHRWKNGESHPRPVAAVDTVLANLLYSSVKV